MRGGGGAARAASAFVRWAVRLPGWAQVVVALCVAGAIVGAALALRECCDFLRWLVCCGPCCGRRAAGGGGGEVDVFADGLDVDEDEGDECDGRSYRRGRKSARRGGGNKYKYTHSRVAMSDEQRPYQLETLVVF